MNLLVNFAAFQLGWFAAVLGGANDLAWAGTLAVLGIVLFHLVRAAQTRRELLLVAIVGVIGALWESLLVVLGLTWYPYGTLIDGVAPYWIVAMWLLFATTLNVSMRWMHGHLWLASISGALFGPLAFYAGSRLGGVGFPDFSSAMIALAAGWAVIMPLLILLARRLDGTRPVLARAPACERTGIA
jgi:hypothetical protein